MLRFTSGIRFADHPFIYRHLRHTVTTVNRYLPLAEEIGQSTKISFSLVR